MATFFNSLNDPDLVDDVKSRENAMKIAADIKLRDMAANAAAEHNVDFEVAYNSLRTGNTNIADAHALGQGIGTETDPAVLRALNESAAATKSRGDAASTSSASYDFEPFSLPTDKLIGVASFLGAATAALARTTWRGLAYGEMIVDETSSDEDVKYVGSKPERWVKPIGAENGTRSQYIMRWGNKNHFAATAGWWMREAHHDPQGTDPMMISMLCVAFIAGMFYSSFLEALLLCLLIEAFEWFTWLAVRGASRVIAAELDQCESRGVAMVYNFLAFFVGAGLAKYVIYTWTLEGGSRLHSFWDANARDVGCPAANNGVYLVWAPCTDTVSFIVVAMLFLSVVFASFRRLYVPSMLVLALLVPVTAVLATERENFFYTLFATVASVFYFMLFVAAPIKQTYMWNAAISIAFYLFAYSMLVLSRTNL